MQMQLLDIILMTPDPSGKSGSMANLLLIGLMIVVFWLFMIRPQTKKVKQQKQFINDLQKGDKIVTTAGIHATINKINDDGTLSVEVSPGSYLRIEKEAISLDWTARVNKVAPEAKK
jgi:preprotein translocase subunit YajC